MPSRRLELVPADELKAALADGIRFDYDMGIVDNFRLAADQPPVDSWPLLHALAGRPVTILRGGLSDLLSNDVAERMGIGCAGQQCGDA